MFAVMSVLDSNTVFFTWGTFNLGHMIPFHAFAELSFPLDMESHN